MLTIMLRYMISEHNCQHAMLITLTVLADKVVIVKRIVYGSAHLLVCKNCLISELRFATTFGKLP